MRRAPLAVFGSLGSIATAAAVAVTRRSRDARKAEVRLDALLDHFGGRIDRLKGGARKQFRKQLQKEMNEVDRASPRDVAIETVSGVLTAMATTMAQNFARRLLGDERDGETRR